MKLPRFIGDYNFNNKNLYIEDVNLTKQLRKVLRKNIGDEIILCDGKNNEARCKISKLAKNFLRADVLELTQIEPKQKQEVTLYASIIKKDNFEFICQKVTEIGVARIVPVISTRTIKSNVKIDRLKKIMTEASEQSGRTTVPELNKILTFQESFEDAKSNDINLFFDIKGISIVEIENELKSAAKIGLFIGPEGGWEKNELDTAKYEKMPIINLSGFTLRAETAAIVAVYSIIHILS